MEMLLLAHKVLLSSLPQPNTKDMAWIHKYHNERVGESL
jgi:hypothetical protein